MMDYTKKDAGVHLYNYVDLNIDSKLTCSYQERLAAEALRQTENDVNAATETLNEKPELLVAAIEEKG